MHISEEKQHLRDSIKERISRMPQHALLAEGRSITRRILENLTPEIRVICAYYPLKDEANISPLLPELLEKGYTLFLPRFDNRELTFRHVSNLKSLVSGALGIPEPPLTNDEVDERKIDLVIVPGRAFDRRGYRIGRGNGGYDKWIARQRKLNPGTQYWGVALDCQLLNEIPVEEHDERMDRILMSRNILSW